MGRNAGARAVRNPGIGIFGDKNFGGSKLADSNKTKLGGFESRFLQQNDGSIRFFSNPSVFLQAVASSDCGSP